MNKLELFQKFLITQEEQIQIEDFLLNSILILIFALILEFTYKKCGKTISNRKMFSNSFLLIMFTTMLIISIVKSSLALSLGLVGALSIVRFRTAIKEPEELAYLFFSISVGLGLGANFRLITFVAFLIMIAIMWLRHLTSSDLRGHNLYFTLSGKPAELSLSKLNEIVKQNFKQFDIKRYDENEELIEVSYLVDTDDVGKMESCKNQLQSISPNIRISFVDSKNF
jgi:hypothetical protein